MTQDLTDLSLPHGRAHRLPPGMAHTLELRRTIEVEAAALAARKGSRRGLFLVSRGAGRLVTSVGRRRTFERLVAFHVAVLHATENPFYFSAAPVVEAIIISLLHMMRIGDEPDRAVWRCEVVASAILAGDDFAARSAMAGLIDVESP